MFKRRNVSLLTVIGVVGLFSLSLLCSATEVSGLTQLRGDHYVLLYPQKGEKITFNLNSVSYSVYSGEFEGEPGYKDSLSYSLIDSFGEKVKDGFILRGKQKEVSCLAGESKIYLLVLNSNRNACTFNSNIPSAIIISPDVPLRIFRYSPPLYFYVPTGVREFSLFAKASDIGEGVDIRILSPTGKVMANLSGDVNDLTQVKVKVAEETEGKVWSIEIKKPEGLVLEDVYLYLSSNVPPFVAESKRNLKTALSLYRERKEGAPPSAISSFPKFYWPRLSGQPGYLGPQKTTLPFTYCCQYTRGKDIGSVGFYNSLKSSPPNLMHVGNDTLFVYAWGASTSYSDCFFGRRLLPEEVEERAQKIREYVASIHKSGVKTVIPYICDQSIFGDYEKRLGFWEFYDHWNDYSKFGFGPKPKEDPITWHQREPDGSLHFNYSLDSDRWPTTHRYCPCPNNPDWQRYLQAIVRNIAECGYDGIFVDNNMMPCYCQSCQKAFSDYLKANYSKEALKENFGVSDVNEVKLGQMSSSTLPYVLEEYLNLTPAQIRKVGGNSKLIWAETTRFRSLSIANLLSKLKEEGEKIKPGFIVIPNISSFPSAASANGRVKLGHDAVSWTGACDFVLFEEDDYPGQPREKGNPQSGVVDHIFQSKWTFSAGLKATIFCYQKEVPRQIELGYAEAAAFTGGGAFVNSGLGFPEERSAYNKFFSDYPYLFEGMESGNQIAIVFFLDEARFGNLSHVEEAFRIKDFFVNNSVPFDIITEGNLNLKNLSSYRLVVIPNLEEMTDQEASALQSYVRRGGRLIVTGETSYYNWNGQKRGRPALGNLVIPDEKNPDSILFHKLGEGMVAYSPSLFYDAATFLSCAEKLTGEPLSLVEKKEGYYPAVNLFYKEGETIILHLVNYHILPLEAGQPTRITDIKLRVPIPEKTKVTAVKSYQPGKVPEDIKFKVGEKAISFTIPEVDVYKVVQIQLTK